MRFATRIWIIVVTTVVELLVMGSLGLYSLHESMLDARKVQITQIINYSDAILAHFYEQERTGKMSRQEAQERAKEAISAMREGRDYVLVRSMTDNIMLVHPIASRVGKVDAGAKMPDGRDLVMVYNEALQKSGNGRAFVWGAAPLPGKNDNKAYPKLIGIKVFEPWNWLTGVGYFVDDINDFFWAQARIYIVVGCVLVALLAWLVFGMRNAILKQLGGQPEIAADRMKKIANGDLTVEVPVGEDDNTSLMASLKVMQLKLNNISSSIQENTESLNEQMRSFDLMAKNYLETKSPEQFNFLLVSVKKIGKTIDILGKSVARIKI